MRRHLATTLALVFLACCMTAVIAADAPEDTPKAAATREKLKKKFSFKWKDTSFGDVKDELKEEGKFGLIVDTKSGVNLNKQITKEYKDLPMEEILDDLTGRNGWGWYVKSQKGGGYDGVVYIKSNSKERGWEGVDGKPGAAKKE